MSLILTFALSILTVGIMLFQLPSGQENVIEPQNQVLALNETDDEPVRDTAEQAKLFDQCKKDAEADGNLTEDEYYGCAYSIYG